MSAHRNRVLRPLILALAISASLPTFAGTTCQLLDVDSNDIGDGGADAGNDLGGQANATACGRNAKATNAAATAFGSDAQATGIGSVAVGASARATESMALAAGNSANASGIWSVALGQNSAASNWGAIGLGSRSVSSGLFSTAVGMASQATGSNASAFGGFLGTTQDSLVPGRYTQAVGNASSAFGAAAHAMAGRSSAFGANSQVTSAASNSVALGADAVAAEAGVVSLGHAATDLDNLGTAYGSDLERRLIHVAAGIGDTDAVNVQQLNSAIAGVSADLSPVAAALGGGASWSGGVFGAPSYTLLGNSYDNVGDAFAAINGWMQGNANGVQYDDPGKTQVTLQGGNGTQIKNVADGVDATDAVNRGQMDAGDATTLASANAYTDGRETAIRTDMSAGDAATLSAANTHADAGDAATLTSARDYTDTTATTTLHSANAYTDTRFANWNDDFNRFRDEVEDRFNTQDRRIDRVGAVNSAMSAAALNTAGLPGTNRLGVGVGMQGGEAAMAVGYQRLVKSNVSVSLAAGFANDESNVAAGAGFSW